MLPKNQLRNSSQGAILLLLATGPSTGTVWSLRIWKHDKGSRNAGWWCQRFREHCSGRQHFLKPRMIAAFPGDSSFHSVSLSPLPVTPQKANWCSLWKLFLSHPRCCRCREGHFTAAKHGRKTAVWAGLYQLLFLLRETVSLTLHRWGNRSSKPWAFCWRLQDSVISELCFMSIGT